ncbi:MAG: class I SAM-dependent methyltransferase [Bacteroidota bacterium]|nr:class I SAM-dependent methyltransferase [Bacteroidota bacterium]
MDSFQSHHACLISGSTNLKPMKGYEKDYLVKSQPAGFVFCSRIPTQDELITHYESYGREDYLSPITVKRYGQILDDFEKYRKTGKMLDVGCGIGLFLAAAKERGWEVYGTEFTDKAISICKSKGITMQQGRMDAAWFAENEFDVITSFEVLEHINNPLEEMSNIQRILRPGGLFYFTTPNFNAIARYSLKTNYNVICYPEHLCYYTKRTINYLMKKSGFKKLKLKATGISMTRIRISMKKSNEALISPTSTDEKIRESFESNKLMGFIKNCINVVFSLTGTGSSLKGWYIK